MSRPPSPPARIESGVGARSETSKFSFLWISLGVVILDQWTKWWVERTLTLHEARSAIPGFLSWTHIRNSGVAFGLFAASGDHAATLLLLALGLSALAVVGFYFWRTPAERRLLLLALSLVVGGAVGNLLDRLANGGVTDFVDVYVGAHHWPAFNVADSAITIGLVLMAFETLLPTRDPAD